MASLQFNWESCYELGIKEIDDQHKKLVGIFNKLAKAFLAQKTKHALSEILIELNQYADYHFQAEEKFFAENKLNDMKDHIQEHKNYMFKMKQFEETNNQGINIDFSLLSFLKRWWSDHILVSDKDYAKKVKST